MQQYLESIRPYLPNLINNFRKSGERKIQVNMKPKFISPRVSNEKCTMHIKSNNMEIMIGKDTDEIIE